MAVVNPEKSIDLSKVRPLDLTAFLPKVMGGKRRKVSKVGLELEGLWKTLPSGTGLQHDGSVIVPYTPKAGDNPCPMPAPTPRGRDGHWNGQNDGGRVGEWNAFYGVRTGELASEPLELEKMPLWLKKFYPHQVNETCGFHIHLSFRTALFYQRLMTPVYPATVVDQFLRWAKTLDLPKEHPLWERCMGKSKYCQLIFDADRQAVVKQKAYDQNRPGHRYTVINYCYGRYNTLECRLLPMFSDVNMAIDAVEHLVNVTNAFLHATVEREQNFTMAMVVDESNEAYREYRDSTIYAERRDVRTF